MAEFGHDGWYLDGPEWPMACNNPLHGCGYRAPDGTLRPTYDIFAMQFMAGDLTEQSVDGPGTVGMSPKHCREALLRIEHQV